MKTNILDILKDSDGVYSCARVCAVSMIPVLYIAVYAGRDAATISAIIVGGIGSLSVRNLGTMPKPDNPEEQGPK